jgi:pyruvate dehydrogenase E2 component (dihydrolipoamide acetyltransferase)
MADVVMPRLSDSMEEGTILQWLKEVGDEIAVGDELVEIETDKANMAYESDIAGTLTEVLAKEGETLPVGAPIARVGDPGVDDGGSPAGPVGAGDSDDPSPAGPATAGGPPPPPVAKASSEAVSPAAPPAGEDTQTDESQEPQVASPAKPQPQEQSAERVKASPLARRLAKEKGLELSQLSGSGPGGRIIKVDVERAAASAGGAVDGGVEDDPARSAPPSGATGPADDAPSPEAAKAETAKGQVTYQDLTKLQSVVARRMAESKATAPHFYLEIEIDMDKAVKIRKKLKSAVREGEPVPSFNDMVVKACALALREFPRANGAYRDGRFELYSRVNVGVAVAAQGALVVPTVFDADRKGLQQIAIESRTLAQRVRDGQITPPELSGATFTVSNLGMYGIDVFAAVINPPQAALLAVGAIAERPAVRKGSLTTANTMWVNLACDHRILYGADGAEFLARIRSLLEEPISLAL